MTTTIRELNETDRIYIEEQLEIRKNSGMSISEYLILTVWNSFSSGSIVSLVWVTICSLIGILPSITDWQKTTIVYYGVLIIFGSLFAYMIWSVIIIDYLDNRSYLDRLSHELKHNRVEDSNATVEEVKCFQELEHLMKIYLLRLSDGRIRVRHDYESADVEGRGKSPRSNFPISREMKIIHFTILGEFRYEFGPSKIRKPRSKDLTIPPEKWPEDETWLEISWNEVDEIFSS